MEINGYRRPHPDFVHLCYELTGGPAVPLSILALRRVAAAWRGPGTFEERMLDTVRAAQAEGSGVWESIINAREEQDQYDEAMFKLYIAELERKAEGATSEPMRALRRKFITEETLAFRSRFVASCAPINLNDP